MTTCQQLTWHLLLSKQRFSLLCMFLDVILYTQFFVTLWAKYVPIQLDYIVVFQRKLSEGTFLKSFILDVIFVWRSAEVEALW